MHTWLSSSLHRFYLNSPAGSSHRLTLRVARAERASFQVVCRTDAGAKRIMAHVQAPEEFTVQVRRVGQVPMLHWNTDTPRDEVEGIGHVPGFVPDPLLPESVVDAGPYETHAFWITLSIRQDTAPGRYVVLSNLTADADDTMVLTTEVIVHTAVLPRRRDFPVTNWLYADALCDWYQVDLGEERFWQVLEPYLANMAAHGQDTSLIPLFTLPTDGVKRPTQLLGVHREGDGFQFDWTSVQRWVRAAQAHGMTHWEWPHLFTQWGAERAIRIYEGLPMDKMLLWPPETPATSTVYRDFLARFLPEFGRFLHSEGIMDNSFFHLSDEPKGVEQLARYRAARAMVRDLAPWMRVMDALSEVDFSREALVDIPVPIISTAPMFSREGFPAWAYFCCGPRGRYLNRLLDTPLAKIRMAGWLFYRLQAHGFLHWGYNYWYQHQSTQLIDPYRVSDGLNWPTWPYGDPFVVYPGPTGPVDSVRWEVFAESLQDYALLQAAGISPEDAMLRDIHDYADFPRDAGWLDRRTDVLNLLGDQ